MFIIIKLQLYFLFRDSVNHGSQIGVIDTEIEDIIPPPPLPGNKTKYPRPTEQSELGRGTRKFFQFLCDVLQSVAPGGVTPSVVFITLYSSSCKDLRILRYEIFRFKHQY
jgi:hypothetical protein